MKATTTINEEGKIITIKGNYKAKEVKKYFKQLKEVLQ